MATKLQRFTRGQAPTLLDANRANELVDAVNSLIQSKGVGGIKVTVEGSGRLVISGAELLNSFGDFTEEELDIVDSNNRASFRIFLTRRS
jgi:hypothetical protein